VNARRKPPLRALDERDLRAVTGGVIGIIDEYKPSESLRVGDQTIIFWYPDGGTVSGGGPHV